MRAPECGFSAAKCREGAKCRQRIASTPAPPSHYPIGRIRKETIQEAAEAGELPGDEHVARSARAHAAVESRAVVAGTGRDVVVDVDGVDARGLQRIARQVQRGKYPPAEPGALVVSRSKRPVERGRCAAT